MRVPPGPVQRRSSLTRSRPSTSGTVSSSVRSFASRQPARWTASAYSPREMVLTNTRPLTSARSTVRSPPSTNAPGAPTTSSRSTPRSSAMWLRVPAGTHTFRNTRSATIACEPSPPAIASPSAPRSTASRTSVSKSVPGLSSIGWIPRARASAASENLSASPPPERGLRKSTRRRREAAALGRSAWTASVARAAPSETASPATTSTLTSGAPTRDDHDRARERQPGKAQTRHTRIPSPEQAVPRPRHTAQQHQAAREFALGDSRSEGDRRRSSRQRDDDRHPPSHGVGLP